MGCQCVGLIIEVLGPIRFREGLAKEVGVIVTKSDVTWVFEDKRQNSTVESCGIAGKYVFQADFSQIKYLSDSDKVSNCLTSGSYRISSNRGRGFLY